MIFFFLNIDFNVLNKFNLKKKKYVILNFYFVDVNECLNFIMNKCFFFNNCVNILGFYNCICLIGYFLENDGRICIGKNDEFNRVLFVYISLN